MKKEYFKIPQKKAKKKLTVTNMVNNAHNDPFSGKKTRKAKKNLSHGNLTYSTKGVQKKKETGKKRALKTKPNYKRLSAVAEHKKCSITNKKKWVKKRTSRA